MNFDLKDDYVYEESISSKDGETVQTIIRRSIITKEEELLTYFDGLFIDIAVKDDMVIFTSKTQNETNYITVFNLVNNEINIQECFGSYLYESTHIYIVNNDTKAKYRLDISEDQIHQVKVE